MDRKTIAMAAVATLLWSQPALAQAIDLSAVTHYLIQSWML